MKSLFVFLLATVLSVPAFAQGKMPTKSATYDAQIIRVSDGDTIVIAAPFLPAPLKPELAVRIYGVDTPEKGHRAQPCRLGPLTRRRRLRRRRLHHESLQGALSRC